MYTFVMKWTAQIELIVSILEDLEIVKWRCFPWQKKEEMLLYKNDKPIVTVIMLKHGSTFERASPGSQFHSGAAKGGEEAWGERRRRR